MKKLILLLLFIPLVSFGQDEDVISFEGYDIRGNYISKIKKSEVNSTYDGIKSTRIVWKGADSINDNIKRYSIGHFNLFNYMHPGGVTFEKESTYPYLTNNIIKHYSSKENYKYLTEYEIEKKENEIVNYEINYGLRLLKVNPTSRFYDINDLFYQKTVKYKNNKTTIYNKYNIAIEYDDVYIRLWQFQKQIKNFFNRVDDSGKKEELTNALLNGYKRDIWIKVDDEQELGYSYYNNFNFPPSVYPEQHIISLNKDFEFILDIEKGDRSDETKNQDHYYNISLGLDNPRGYISDFKTENAISYQLRYISPNTDEVLSVERYCSTCESYILRPYQGSYVFKVSKKIDGIIYEEKKLFSKDLQRSLMYKNGKGKINILRRGEKVIFSLNGYVLDISENHNFQDNSILLNSTYAKPWNVRGINDNNGYNNNFDFIISQTLDKKIDFSAPKAGSWKGNGSGFFISKSGYIATNYHVIEDAIEIEVEYINNQKNYKYKAEIIQTDPYNDLAILKIKDSEFKNLASIPYNFKTRSSDVGSSVFALGFPMALSGMGKEIKFTDGKISSKTGFNGDIRTYQTTTPIQGGNSGGPLFDYKGNLVGINSAKISSSKADNVSYSIKSSYLNNLMDVLPESVSIPSDTSLSTKSLTDLIKILSNYVVLIKVK